MNDAKKIAPVPGSATPIPGTPEFQTSFLRRYRAAEIAQPSAAWSGRWCHSMHDSLARFRFLLADRRGRLYLVLTCTACSRHIDPAAVQWSDTVDPLYPDAWPPPPATLQPPLL